MKIAPQIIELNCPETEVYHRLLSLDNRHILELGCGNADITRDIATAGPGRRVTALEVDRIAHEQNLQIADLPSVTFGLGGAEDIPLETASADVVFMFKSLHHVPVDKMDQSLREIQRVLKPGGMAYISEPIYAGDFNEILRQFHDEREVREAAFYAVKRAVGSGLLKLVEEVFFNTPMDFEHFDDFENRVIRVTHTDHKLDAELYQRVRQMFETHAGEDGARFLIPIRVDLLQKGSR
ncbi:MAG: class I SAM-dependent methyltransferase [Gammaproteobacteria bacterium]|nr:class I SAM-dependent methyltransferase [Gammaproteobacteria bacterium]NNL06536.1 class I SAM-dependent methyltransferase [Gammaproteobacteria bacterium]